MNKRYVIFTSLALILASIAPLSFGQSQSGIPKRPEEIKFAPRNYSPPKRDKYRHVLSTGSVAYLVEDHDLPLVNVTVLVRTGEYVEPEAKAGLAGLVGNQLRAGGTASKKSEDFDEVAEFLAANLTSFAGETQASVSVNCLSKDLEKGLALFFEMLKSPGFQDDRLTLAKTQLLQQIERRNDSTDNIEEREWERLIRGDGFFTTRHSTKASIESITRDDLLAFHKKYYQPGGFIFAVSGDFKTAEMIAALESGLKGWPVSKEKAAEIPKPTHTPVPGVYAVHKPEVNQGRVSIGHLGVMRGNPDVYALRIMDDILGAGGFTSRLVSRIRSDEGLAYSALSDFSPGVYYPGTFRAQFQSKSATCAQAAQIVVEEVGKIRSAPVSQQELETAVNQAIETFPSAFSTASRTARTFAEDEYTGRAPDYWDTYRDRIRAVTAADVLRVAKQYLHPDQLVILIVGNLEDIAKGDPDKPQYSITKLPGGDRVHRIPLPDPLTMTYPRPSQ